MLLVTVYPQDDSPKWISSCRLEWIGVVISKKKAKILEGHNQFLTPKWGTSKFRRHKRRRQTPTAVVPASISFQLLAVAGLSATRIAQDSYTSNSNAQCIVLKQRPFFGMQTSIWDQKMMCREMSQNYKTLKL